MYDFVSKLGEAIRLRAKAEIDFDRWCRMEEGERNHLVRSRLASELADKLTELLSIDKKWFPRGRHSVEKLTIEHIGDIVVLSIEDYEELIEAAATETRRIEARIVEAHP